ncbi:hypothetical protein OA165_02845 [Prochlorococcus sp. AH-736-A21]|nr:hypothetical protein [Prochlorococcus sp. AH-736-A21]
MKILKNTFHKYSLLSLPIKLFSLLISSVIVVLLSAYFLDHKFGGDLFILSEQTTTFSALLSPKLDGGYFEFFQYILLIWCSILSAVWVIGKKYYEIIYIPFIYFYLFIDDALCIHDKIAGYYIFNFFKENNLFNNDFVRVKDFAEWTYWAIVLIVILIIAKPRFQNKNVEIQNYIRCNFSLFLGMAFFALIIDLIAANFHSWILIEQVYIKNFITIILMLTEEVGEIGVISVACVWLFSKNFSTGINKFNS